MSSYTGRRFVNPLDKNIGRRTGKDVRAGKHIRVCEDGFENFDDYFSESDAEVTREYSRRQSIKEESECTGIQDEYKENQSSHCNRVSQSMPSAALSNTSCNNFLLSQTLSQNDAPNRSKFGWLRNRNIGRRTGKNLTANKQIRVDENGFENFDDYFSETDVSSLSSGFNGSVVKPHPRRSSVHNHLIEHGPSSVSSQDSHRTGTADEMESSEMSQEEETDTHQELAQQRDTVTDNSESCRQENTYTSYNKETSTRETDKNSAHNDSNRSPPDDDEGTLEAEFDKEDSLRKIQVENSEKQGNSTSEMSQSQTHTPNYVDTPLSSKRSRSHISVSSDQYSKSKISHKKTQEINSDKRKLPRKSETNSNEISLGKHKMSIGANDSVHKSRTGISEKSRASLNSITNTNTTNEKESKDSMISEHNSDDDDDDDDEDTEVKEFDDNGHDGMSHTDSETEEHNDQHPHEDTAEELEPESEADTESDGEMGKEESIIETGIDESKTISSHDEIQKEKLTTNSDTVKENIDKSVSRNSTDVQVTENGDASLSENESGDYENGEDLRPSQAQTNIDVAGNRSGSITKLDIPMSVVSFDRTRKRLSYSASEASEESKQRNKSRIERANTELFDRKVSPSSDKVNGKFQPLPSKYNTAKKILSNEKVKESAIVAEESSDFLCLASRSTLPQRSQIANDDDDDDIVILDYEKQKGTSRIESKKSAKNKIRKQPSKSDSESQSDSWKQQDNLKKGSKSEMKVRKTKRNNKSRRKTTHELNKVNESKMKKSEQTKPVLIDDLIPDAPVDNSPMISHMEEGINANDDESDQTLTPETNVKKGKRERFEQTDKTSLVGKNTSLKKSGKSQHSKSRQSSHNRTENTDSDSKTSTAMISCENYVETVSEEKIGRKSKPKRSSRKSNRRKNSPENTNTENAQFGEGKGTHLAKSKRKANETRDDLDSNDDDNDENSHETHDIEENSPVHQTQNKKKFAKKVKRKSVTYDDDNLIGRNHKTLKRKSSSEDNLETESNGKKGKRLKSDKKSRANRKNRKEKSSSSSSDNVDGNHNEDDISAEVPLDDSGNRTPQADSRLSVPAHFGSGVSFRVSRRSEMLEDIGSGYVGEVTVQMEPTGGLTPCISRPGAARKSKGRRVTICPEENTEHTVSGGTSLVNATPLPDPSSTPVHICETTHSATPHPGQHEKSVIEDRLIKPSPPEEGLRRSQRTRLKPIAWYKNEQVVFDYRRRSGPAIIGVKPSLEVKWNKLEEEKRKKRMLKYQIRKASQIGKDKPYRKLSIHTELPNDAKIEDISDPEITIYNQNTQSEDGIDCIGKRDAFKPVGPRHETPKKEDPYLITKQLNHPCMSAGKLCIKPNAEKPEQLVTADYVVFFIEHGKVLVKIHKTTVLLETGDTFLVPIGNTYSISNLRSDTARLFYTIHKQVDNPDQPSESLHEGL